MASACEMDGDVQGTLDTCNIPSNHSNEKENSLGKDNTVRDITSTTLKDQAPLQHYLPPKHPVVRFSSCKGDNTEQVEVIEFTDTEVMDPDSSSGSRFFGATKGAHITLMSLILFPVALIASVAVAFYFGAWTWYNLYIYFSEERTVCHKIFICPILIITFPLTVGLSSIGIGIFAAFIQISWSFYNWKTEFLDFEKGFYGWLCFKLGLSMCSPYDILEYTDESEMEPMKT